VIERAALRTWTAWVAAGEAVGFAVPAVVATALRHQPDPPLLTALVLAGAVEGALLGGAQAHVLHRWLPQLDVRRWVLLTSLAAAFAWLLGMGASVTADTWSGWPVAGVTAAAAVLAPALLGSIGAAQWLELRRHLERAGRWIAVTALAWLLGLGVFFAIAPPLWQPGQPGPVVALVGLLAGVAMAVTMALVTGVGLLRLLRRPQASLVSRSASRSLGGTTNR
jgi:hypothetical protein